MLNFALYIHIMIAKIVFRKREETGEIIALFPYVVDGNGLCLCYSIKHKEHKHHYKKTIDITVMANSREYNDTYNEMVSMGYDLTILKRNCKRISNRNRGYSQKNYKKK